MQTVVGVEAESDGKSVQAVMNISKFSGAIVALFIGYVCGILTLTLELAYFHWFVKLHPDYNKYSKTIHCKNT